MSLTYNYRIKDLCTVKRGGSPRPIEQYIIAKDMPGYNWLLIGDIESDADYIEKTGQKISEEGLHKTTLVKVGELILSNSMSFGRPYITNIETCIHDGWLALKDIKHNLIDTKYFYYLLKSAAMQRKFNNLSAGSGVKNLKREIVENILIKIPDLETQQKIVQILEVWDDNIDKLESLIKHEKNKQQWLAYRLICNNKNEIKEKLCDLATISTGKKDVNQGRSTGKYPFFTCAKEHIWSNDYSFDGEAICIAGNGEIGKSFYYNGKFEAYQRTYVLTDFTISGKYLNYVIKYLFKEMVEHQKQMSAMPYIKLETLKNFIVPVPDDQEIDKIVKILNDEEAIISDYEILIHRIKLQKQYLLNHLISGDFDLTNIKLENGKEQQ